MKAIDSFYLGVDIGSVSVKLVVVNSGKEVVEEYYQRHKGQPIQVLINLIEEVLSRIEICRVKGLAITGVGSDLVASLMGGTSVNEIITHTIATGELYPSVNTIIEMGGEDSKLIILEKDEGNGKKKLKDFEMNTQCAAGTGSFLDQQASRLGISIEDEFATLALKSKNPPRIAGRCSVFAKSDMIHLQQIGTPDYDILAGLCYALARCFKSNLGKGKNFEKPISFQGGVAANKAVVKAFEDIFDLNSNELIIPKHHFSMGAIGATLFLMDNPNLKKEFSLSLQPLKYYLENKIELTNGLEPLPYKEEDFRNKIFIRNIKEDNEKADAYVGVDVGSLSTNVVVIDKDKEVLVRRYLKTAGRPLEAVCKGLGEIGREIGDKVRIRGAGTTGSGRYLTAEYVGGDIIRNEITSQATAAIHIDPKVDTIFEIGGQDSKYVSIDNGKVVDFEMNKVCAAGTGSFLEEQADKLDMNIIEEFGDMALKSKNPCRFGDRCTVFMESDLVSYQQKGAKKNDLVAGLAYSIVLNYLNRVVEDRRIGNHIFFQGGVASNKGVVSAFEKVLGKKMTVPPHHDVTGAIGVAILAMESQKGSTRFKGFDLSNRKYETSFIQCRDCENMCEIRKIRFNDEKPLYYGSRCEKFEIDNKKAHEDLHIPDLFKERNELLFNLNDEREYKSDKERIKIGIPRVLYFYELFPFWKRFFKELGFEIVLSDYTNQHMINVSIETETAETCFPLKITHGHILNLMEKGVDYIFLPSMIDDKRINPKLAQNYYCPLVQAAPFIVKSAIDFKNRKTKFLYPTFHYQNGKKYLFKAIIKFGKTLGKSKKGIINAIQSGEKDQERFYRKIRERGKEIINSLKDDDKAFVIISRPYNGCDPGMNIGLPRKLRNMGVLAIPMDFLSLEGIDISYKHPNMYWSYGQKILAAAEIIRKDPKLNAIYLSNFKCGPDSFISHFVKELMKDKLCLELEIDEHSADAGIITRCEAFLDSLRGLGQEEKEDLKTDYAKKMNIRTFQERVIYMPHMSDHAYCLSAAMRACNIKSEVLEESDSQTLELGKKYTSGKECFPFVVTTGDLIKKIKSPGFDPSRSAFLMPSADGPCRFGQYNVTQRLLLERLGYGDVLVISPDSKDSYTDFDGLDTRFQRIAWRGIIAMDLLERLMNEIRPYEVNKGESDRARLQGLRMLERCVERGGEDLLRVMREIKEMMEQIKVDRSQKKPVIGVVGEIFLRSNRFSNKDVVRMIEKFGGEVWVAPLSEWLFYTNFCYKEKSLNNKKYLDYLKAYIKNKVQKHDEHELMEIFYDSLRNNREPTTEELLDNSYSYLPSSVGGEAILSIGKAIDFIRKGISGMVNVMPFTCMPGMIVTAISKRLREDLNSIPWINLSYDGQEDIQTQKRIEAFIYQAKQYNGRNRFLK